jgi:hypothetical protein
MGSLRSSGAGVPVIEKQNAVLLATVSGIIKKGELVMHRPQGKVDPKKRIWK